MNGVLIPTFFLACLVARCPLAIHSDELSKGSPYVLDQEWKQLLDAAPDRNGEMRGDKLLELLEQRLNVKAPAWWQPLVKCVGVGPRSAHMIENDNAVEGLSKRWNSMRNVPFTGFTAIAGSVNEKHLEMRDGSKSFILAQQIDWEDTIDDIELGDNGVSGSIHNDLCFLVPKCPVRGSGGPRAMCCFDVTSGKLRWKANLVDGEIGAYMHLQFGSYTEVIVDEDKVIVWTGSEIAALVQAFNVSDGKPLLRFSTNGDRLVDE